MVEHPLIVLAGPTGSGKTALSLALAEAFHGEIISCDSVAVYRRLDIGSAKPTAEERAGVRHYGLDLYAPNEHPTAGDYAGHARAAFGEIVAKGKLPILAGGAGLYMRATLDGLAPSPQRNDALRTRLREREQRRGAGYLHRVLTRLDPAAAALIHTNDTPKLIRSIEVCLSAQTPQTEQWLSGRNSLSGFRVLRMGLNPPRAELYARIDARAAEMFGRGLLDETAAIRADYGDAVRALTTLGYSQALAVLRGELPFDEAILQAQQGHRHYAKRQLTWFRADKQMHWLEGCGDDPRIQTESFALVSGFLQQPAPLLTRLRT